MINNLSENFSSGYFTSLYEAEKIPSGINDFFKNIFTDNKNNWMVKNNKVEEFLTSVIKISAELNINPNWLLAVMYWENSSFNPLTKQKGGSGIGLIQFTDQEEGVKAKELGDDIVAQVENVKHYFQRKNSKNKPICNVIDLYLLVWRPTEFLTGNLVKQTMERSANNEGRTTFFNSDSRFSNTPLDLALSLLSGKPNKGYESKQKAFQSCDSSFIKITSQSDFENEYRTFMNN